MSEFNLKNKVAVITGGANGIGFAIAEEFLKKDVKTVILLDIAEEGIKAANNLNKKYGLDKAIFVKCDVTSDVDTISEKIFSDYKKVDILVNSAGIVNEESIRKTMEVNAIALMEWSMKFYEHMSKEKEGTIINISSMAGYYMDQFGPFYKASKFAVMGFSRSLGHEVNYKKSGVRVIVLCPGFTRTNIGKVHGSSDIDTKQKDWNEYIKNVTWMDPAVVGKAAVHVFEQAISGTAWVVNDSKWNQIVFENILV